jgi:hypothetical protein
VLRRRRRSSSSNRSRRRREGEGDLGNLDDLGEPFVGNLPA